MWHQKSAVSEMVFFFQRTHSGYIVLFWGEKRISTHPISNPNLKWFQMDTIFPDAQRTFRNRFTQVSKGERRRERQKKKSLSKERREEEKKKRTPRALASSNHDNHRRHQRRQQIWKGTRARHSEILRI